MRKFLKISTIAFGVSAAIMMFATPVKAESLLVQSGKASLIQEGNYPSETMELPGSVNKYNGWSTAASRLSSYASAYDAIYAGLKNFEEEIDVSSYNITISSGQIFTIYQSVINDNPDLFFVGGEYNYSYDYTKVLCVYPTYTVSTIDEVNAMTAKYESAIASAAANVDLTQSEELVLLQLHDYLATHCEYDNDNYVANTIPPISHSAYGALVNKIAVCDGYSLALKGMLDTLTDIDAKVLTSNEMNHAWNQVKLNGNYYQLDVTFDDPVYPKGSGSTYYVDHKYFLFSDSAAGSFDHYSWESNGINCDSNAYDNSSYHDTSAGIASIYNGKAYLILNGEVQAYDFGYGEAKEKYSFKIQYQNNGYTYTIAPSSMYVYGGKIYCTTMYSNMIYAYDMGNGNLSKACDTQVAPYSIGFEKDTLYYDNNMVKYATDIKKNVDTQHLHTQIRDAKEATCTVDGYTGDKYCTDCGIKLETGTVIKALGHSWDAGVVTKEPTYTENGVKTYQCQRCSTTKTEVIPKLEGGNGIVKDSAGRWCYMVNGVVDINYGGMTEVEGNWLYFKAGYADLEYTGMAENDYGWWYYTDGHLNWDYTGMTENEYGWWYYKNGRLEWNYTGMAENDYGWWYYTDGRLNWNYTGMAENDYGWWYYSNGRLDWNYTGIGSNQYGQWIYVNGKLAWGYNGSMQFNGRTYYANDGHVYKVE